MSDALKGKKILIVDDDADIRATVQAAFEPTGAVLEMAENGNKAVEMIEKSPPDLVLLDMMLPGRSGFLILEYIAREKAKQKKNKTHPPFVIMITGNPGERHKAMAESIGANIYLKKPVSLPKLLAEATKLLGGTTNPPVAKVG